MPEPTSKSVDLLTAKSAAQLLATDLLYLADPLEADSDDFNRKATLASLLTWLTTGIAPLKIDGSSAGTAMQELKGLNFTDPTILTIATGAVTATQSLHIIAAETGTADDVDTFTAAKGVGDVLIVVADTGDTITLKHGTGNIVTFDGTHPTITPTSPALLVRMGTNWVVIKNAASISGALLADGSVAGTAMQELLGLNFTDPTILTIATGAVTATQSLHILAAETGTADDVDTITAAKGVGDMLFVIADTGDTITLKHGTGNIVTFDGTHPTITPTSPALLVRMGTNWVVIKNNAAGTTGLLPDGTVAGTAMQELLGLNFTDPTILTIATGAVTATQSLHIIAAETGTADDVDTFTAAKGVGDVLFVIADTGDTITLKHGTGNIVTFDGTHPTITPTSPALLVRMGTNWVVIKNNAAGTTGLLPDGTVAGTAMQELLGLNFTDPTILTLATGAVTATQSLHILAAETGTADDVDTITAAKGVGDVLFVIADTGDTITLKHGTGNIVTFDGTHPTITPTSPALLVRMGTNWVVIKNNASGSSDVVSDTTPQLGGPLDANGNQIQESLGTYSFASVTMTPNDDGNSYYFTDSGFTLTNIVIAPAGTEITIDFAAVGTITPGGNLVIDASNITVAASDVAKWLSNGTNWRLVSYKRFNGRALVTEVSEDTTPQAGGNFSMNAHMMQFSKGADIASATSLTLGSDGNSFDVTGTTTITSIGAKAVGTWSQLHFDGVLTLTHHATDLILPGGANITTQAGDIALIFEYATGDYRVIYHRASGLPVVSSGSSKIGAAETTLYTGGIQTLTTTPADVTGSSQAIIPTSTASTLLYTCSFMMASTGAGAGYVFLHFYRDGSEITSAKTTLEVENSRETRVTVQFAVANTSTSSTTFKLQARIYVSQPVKLHETVAFDGATSSVSSSATVSVLEIID